MIINLISGPRNISTALMYSFAQRSDTVVSDEPFYAVYLLKSGARHPGRETVLQTMSSDEHDVYKALLTGVRKPVLFIKNMAHHMQALEQPLIPDAKNIFLIRDPAQILASYAEVIAKPVMRDVGIAYQYTLFQSLAKQGQHAVVLDSGFLLHDPPAVLAQLCRHCSLPYDQRMVQWPPGPKPYDGVWAPYWYTNVHLTTGFESKTTPRCTLPRHLRSLLDEAMPYYEKLRSFSIIA